MDNITKYILEREEINDLMNDVVKDLKEFSVGNDPWFNTTTITLNPTDKAIGSIALAAAIIYGSYKAVEKLAIAMSPKKCRQYKLGSPAYRICRNKVDIAKAEKQVSILRSKISLCSHARTKQKCESKIKEKIAKLEQKINEKKARIKELEPQT
jgi:hypothetical protein